MLTTHSLVAALLLISGPAAAEPTIGAVIRSEGVLDTAGRTTLTRSGPETEDGFTQHTFLRAFAKGETRRGDAWFVEARAQHHLLAGSTVEGWFEVMPGETGWDGRVGGERSPARLRAGLLRERWGKTDLLPVLDVLNPTDARIGPLTPSPHRRVPLPMATLSFTSRGDGPTIRSETTFAPFAGTDRLWIRETDWSILRQEMAREFISEEINSDADPWPAGPEVGPSAQEALDNLRRNLVDLDPSLRRGQDAATNQDGLPQALFGNGNIAQRVSVDFRNADVAIVAGWLRSTFPQAILDPELRTLLVDERLPNDVDELAQVQRAISVGTPLAVTWPRTGLVGLEGSALVGPLQLRGEAGYLTDRVVRQAYGNSTTVPQLAGAIGVDYVRGTSLQLTLEARWQHLFDAPTDLVFARPDQVQIALGFRTGLLQERLRLTVGGAYDATFNELYLRPSVSWRLSDVVELELGGLLLEGFTTPAPRGALDAITYEGGPASYFTENDSVTLAVSVFL